MLYRLLSPTHLRDPTDPLLRDLWWALEGGRIVAVSVDRWWALGRFPRGKPVNTIDVQVESRIELHWRKDGKRWKQVATDAVHASQIMEALLGDGWEPTIDGAAEFGLRNTPGDFLEKRYLKNGARVRAGFKDGARTWYAVDADGRPVPVEEPK